MKKKLKIRFLTLFCVLFFVLIVCVFYIKSPYGMKTNLKQKSEHIGLYLENDSIRTSDESAVIVDGTTATIIKGGTFDLSGNLDNGQIIIDVPKTQNVKLRFEGINIHCEYSAPIWAKSCKNLKIKLPEDYINYLSDGEFYNASADNDTPNACIYAKDDIIINGLGELIVDANFNNGISSRDNIEIENGLITVNSENYALYGKDGIEIEKGSLKLNSESTAIYSKGSIEIKKCKADIVAQNHIIKARDSIDIHKKATLNVCSKRNSEAFVYGENFNVENENSIVYDEKLKN